MHEIQERHIWSSEEEMATHTSILAWKISWTEEPGGLQSTGLQRVIYNWVSTQALRTQGFFLLKSQVIVRLCFSEYDQGNLLSFLLQFPSFLVPSGFEFWVRFLELNSIDNKYVDHLWELSVRGSRGKKKGGRAGREMRLYCISHTKACLQTTM